LDLQDEVARVMSDIVENGDSFFIILYDKALYMNLETFTNERGNKWSSGYMLIRGYYQRVSALQRGNSVTYELIKNKPAYA
jgi:hypothetical protein